MGSPHPRTDFIHRGNSKDFMMRWRKETRAYSPLTLSAPSSVSRSCSFSKSAWRPRSEYCIGFFWGLLLVSPLHIRVPSPSAPLPPWIEKDVPHMTRFASPTNLFPIVAFPAREYQRAFRSFALARSASSGFIVGNRGWDRGQVSARTRARSEREVLTTCQGLSAQTQMNS